MYKCTACGKHECNYDDVIKGEPNNCPDCAAKPGEHHDENCDMQICSVCHGQRLLDDCEGHDPELTKWRGYRPGIKEAAELKVCLNCLYDKIPYDKMPLN